MKETCTCLQVLNMLRNGLMESGLLKTKGVTSVGNAAWMYQTIGRMVKIQILIIVNIYILILVCTIAACGLTGRLAVAKAKENRNTVILHGKKNNT